MKSIISNDELKDLLKEMTIELGKPPKAWEISDRIKKDRGTTIHESTIRGRFIEMGLPLSGGNVGTTKQTQPDPNINTTTTTQRIDMPSIDADQFIIPDELKPYIPKAEEFLDYIERPIDKRLALHYNIGPRSKRYKYPLSQGKQGTGKTWGHRYYAFKHGLPFFLYSCYEDFDLKKLFGDKTILNGNIVFKESFFTKAIQAPSVIVFDEINAVSNTGTYPFHAFLQDRELFIKDADDGQGKIYKIHPECRIGFAQNPKSVKYIGANIKQSNFLGRCTYLTYPEFTQKEIRKSLNKRFPQLIADDVNKFTQYYFAIISVIERADVPVDISIRQLNNVIDLWLHGLPLKESIEDGLASILEAISQPNAKESFMNIAAGVWKELMT